MRISNIPKDSLPTFRVLSISPHRNFDSEQNRFEDRQSTDEAGTPLWSIELLVVTDDVTARSEIVKLKYPSRKNPAEVLNQNDEVMLDAVTFATYKFYPSEFKIVPAGKPQRAAQGK